MRATHTDYLHPKHLRVESAGDVFCMSPSHSQYTRLSGKRLPKYEGGLPRHSTTWTAFA